MIKKLLNDMLYQAHPDIGMTLSVEYICLVTEDELETFNCLCAEDRVTQQREQLGGGGRGDVCQLHKLVNYVTHTP